MHVKEPRTLIVKEKEACPGVSGFALEHPAGWICACYKSSVLLLFWWNWYSGKCKASMAWLYTVLNPTKAAGGVWWIWYTWLHALFTGLYCGVLNPTQSSGWNLMDLVHMATCSIQPVAIWWIWYTWLHAPTKAAIRWAILWSTESNKSSGWNLMDLVHMATCSIHWAILWSTESNKSSGWSLTDLVNMAIHMLYSLGYTLEHWIHQNQAKNWRMILEDLVFKLMEFVFYVGNTETFAMMVLWSKWYLISRQ